MKNSTNYLIFWYRVISFSRAFYRFYFSKMCILLLASEFLFYPFIFENLILSELFIFFILFFMKIPFIFISIVVVVPLFIQLILHIFFSLVPFIAILLHILAFLEVVFEFLHLIIVLPIIPFSQSHSVSRTIPSI